MPTVGATNFKRGQSRAGQGGAPPPRPRFIFSRDVTAASMRVQVEGHGSPGTWPTRRPPSTTRDTRFCSTPATPPQEPETSLAHGHQPCPKTQRVQTCEMNVLGLLPRNCPSPTTPRCCGPCLPVSQTDPSQGLLPTAPTSPSALQPPQPLLLHPRPPPVGARRSTPSGHQPVNSTAPPLAILCPGRCS